MVIFNMNLQPIGGLLATIFHKILEMKLKLDTGLSFLSSFLARDVF